MSDPKARRLVAMCVVFLCGPSRGPAAAEAGETFPGWQGMRVVLQDGAPRRMYASDLDNDGRDEVILVNTRQSRLDIYRWTVEADRTEAPAVRDDEPNELPMAPELRRDELPLEQLPVDVIASDLDGDGAAELIVLVSTPNKVLIYGHEGEDGWKQRRVWDLPVGSYQSHDAAMLMWRPDGDGGDAELLISFQQGVQTLRLGERSRPGWFEPRETVNRGGWWMADLDGDGLEDLIEWTRDAGQTVRWYQRDGSRLLPPQVLYDQSVDSVSLLGGRDEPTELLLLGGSQAGLLRRYGMHPGQASDLGRRDALPLPGGEKSVWTGVRLEDDRRLLVAVDPEQPRLVVHELDASGWGPAQHYPSVADVQGAASVPGHPGMLLLWPKDAGDLSVSRWEGGRFTYPQPMGLNPEASDRFMLALQTVGDAVWWAQRVGEDIELFVWEADAAQPRSVRFEGVGKNADRAQWLGGERLLVLAKFARSPKLIVRTDGKASESEPAHLTQAKLEEFVLLATGGGLRAARAVDGVLQWLDEGLHPTDQVMLGGNERLAGYVPVDDGAWALERGGQFVHLLRPDESNIPRVQRSVRLAGGLALRRDPVLGMMLVTSRGVTRLSEGSPNELSLLQSIDGREGRASGAREATIHRVLTTDVLGTGHDAALLCDDRRHELTVMARTDRALTRVISWPVFEDSAYPYGGGREDELVSEPRAVMGLDIDGDGGRDLALLCHDRLLLYLSREKR